MKRILVPIDFKVQSLNTLKLAISQNKDTDLSVVLVYAETLSDSITELLFYSAARRIEDLTEYEFDEALAILGNRYEGVLNEINIELVHSRSDSYFENFLTAHHIDEIYIPKSYKLCITDRAFDPIPMIRRSNLPVFEMAWETKQNFSERDLVDLLF